jgi:hypothetical protein
MYDTGFVCVDCGKPIMCEGGTCGATGYAVQSDGGHVCYECCAERDKKYLLALKGRESMCLYLVLKDGSYEVTNWPGTLHIRCGIPVKRHHNLAGYAYHTWFWCGDYRYHGIQYGDNTQICHVRRVRG